jgi:hypothetical protein
MRIFRPAFALCLSRFFTVIFILFSTVHTTRAEEGIQVQNREEQVSKLFLSHQPLKFRLEGAFKELSKKRKEERPYTEATMIYQDNAGAQVSVKLDIRVRGKFRAKRETCTFPPLKLKFKKKTLANTIFAGEKKLKLVTHCRNSSRYEQYVLLEYLNYRMHNLLTDYSLRPRLATIEYYDTGSGKVVGTRPGFFLEDEDRMAARLGATPVKSEKIDKEKYQQELLHFAAIFEYLLGNTDFSLVLGPENKDCCHNIIPLQSSDGSFVPIPYDFDATGIVNPPYVSPPEHLGIRSTRQRLYRGYCQNTAGFKKSFRIFQEKQKAIYDLYNNQPGLNDKTLKSTLKYLDQFYATISSDDEIVQEFVDKCRS